MELRRSRDLPVQDVIEQATSGFQTTPTFGQMKHQASARPAEDRSAGQHLGAQRGRFAIGCQPGGALELGYQVEDQQHGPESSLGGEEFLHAKAICAEIMLQFRDPVWSKYGNGFCFQTLAGAGRDYVNADVTQRYRTGIDPLTPG
jgi:hypothetical protein